jgi:hypothetical protein
MASVVMCRKQRGDAGCFRRISQIRRPYVKVHVCCGRCVVVSTRFSCDAMPVAVYVPLAACSALCAAREPTTLQLP